MKQNQKGITLIALVVTIVVLLILAGVTITMIFSNNGVIKKAQEASNKMNEATQNDLTNLNELSNQLDNVINDNNKPVGPELPVTLESLIESKKTVSKNTVAIDKAGKTLTIPSGFKVLPDGPEVNKGVVIEDTKGNQFVWVPVPDPSTMYEMQNGQKVGKLYDFSTEGASKMSYPGKNIGYREPDVVTSYDGNATYLSILGLSTTAQFATQLQTEFDQMITSVEKYKGFYIGRYSTGNLVANTSTEPVVKKGQTAITNVNWYYMYQNSKKIASGNSNITTSMIWGCQWDRTMQWLVESGNKTYAELMDSRSWGNYYDSTGEAATGSGTKQPTGTNEAWKANNIYDLAGNVYKWSIEACNTCYRTDRGGNCGNNGSDSPASSRGSYYPDISGNSFGSAPTLIIK